MQHVVRMLCSLVCSCQLHKPSYYLDFNKPEARVLLHISICLNMFELKKLWLIK